MTYTVSSGALNSTPTYPKRASKQKGGCLDTLDTPLDVPLCIATGCISAHVMRCNDIRQCKLTNSNTDVLHIKHTLSIKNTIN